MDHIASMSWYDSHDEMSLEVVNNMTVSLRINSSVWINKPCLFIVQIVDICTNNFEHVPKYIQFDVAYHFDPTQKHCWNLHNMILPIDGAISNAFSMILSWVESL